MRDLLRRRCAPVISTTTLLFLVLAGCGQPVREERTITWSGDGKAVGFQHGGEGVFVADQEGRGLEKIFEPGPEVIASSTPLWSPVDRRLIFTTARPTDGGTNVRWIANPLDPNGAIHYQRPVRYTCWLREEPREGQAPEPVPLFEADCNHVGCVAANLAVRWHPAGNRILHLKQTSGNEHGLFEYDLRTKGSRQIFRHTAEAMVFDWAPDRRHLVCVLGTTNQRRNSDGIWIGRPGEDDWWYVPGSGLLAEAQLPSLIERLRATRPAWTADGNRFAFVSYQPGTTPQQPGNYFLNLGALATQEITTLMERAGLFTDLKWAPDGERLGAICGGDEGGLLRLIRPGKGMTAPIGDQTVRRFIGWDAAGERLAYVTAASLPLGNDVRWAFLLIPDPTARDAVHVAQDKEGSSPHQVFSGLRVTFPQWSPKDAKVSCWFTSSPSYSSWLSHLLGTALLSGDPAAIFDVTTGEIGWMAVNPHEKVQVGHYYLLKHDYAQAWKWYEEAEREMPRLQSPKPQNLWQNVQHLLAPPDFKLFEYHCLTMLGRHGEARSKLAQFRKGFQDRLAAVRANGPQIGSEDLERLFKNLLDPNGLPATLLQDLYAAEVFLSVDAAKEAEAFFRSCVRTAAAEPARLSGAVVLAQILLLENKNAEYADLLTDTIAPLILSMWEPQVADNLQKDFFNPRALDQTLLAGVGYMTALPMFSPEFVALLEAGQVRALAKRWKALEARCPDDTTRLTTLSILRAAYKRLGLDKEYKEVTERIQMNPRGGGEPLTDAALKEQIETLRTQLRVAVRR